MKDIVMAIFLLLGSFFMLLAATGLLRFRDSLSRLHASTKAPSFALLLILIAVCLHFASWVVILKAVLLILFFYLTAPLAAHAISKANEKE
jgi:multicomponent Na+:H+ antiporter subunit G